MKRGADVRPGVAAGEARGAGRRRLSEGEWVHAGRRARRVRGERRARWRGPGDAALRAGRGGSGSGPGRGGSGLEVLLRSQRRRHRDPGPLSVLTLVVLPLLDRTTPGVHHLILDKRSHE